MYWKTLTFGTRVSVLEAFLRIAHCPLSNTISYSLKMTSELFAFCLRYALFLWCSSVFKVSCFSPRHCPQSTPTFPSDLWLQAFISTSQVWATMYACDRFWCHTVQAVTSPPKLCSHLTIAICPRASSLMCLFKYEPTMKVKFYSSHPNTSSFKILQLQKTQSHLCPVTVSNNQMAPDGEKSTCQ